MKSALTKTVLAVMLLAGVALAGRLIDYPRLAGGFKGDEATYVLMAFSAAEDFDFDYQAKDLQRFYRLYRDDAHPDGVGPDGIFIKQASRITGVTLFPPGVTREPVATTDRLEYGKAFAYPLAAAPFARLGGLGGMFLFNVVLLVGCAWLGATFGRARTGSRAGAVIGVAFVFATVLPVWTAWLTPEIFNVALVFAAYFLWLYKEVAPATEGRAAWWRTHWSDLLAAVLIGVATFSKPNHALLIGPLGLLALTRRQLGRAVAIGALFVAGAGACYGVNLVTTGEWNYQGSAYVDGRISCYGVFPFDAQGTPFGVIPNKCDSKVTNEANDEQIVVWHVFPTRELLGTFVRNAWYFVVGRNAGLVPFFLPGALILLLFLLRFWEARAWHWMVLAVVAGEAWVLLALAPWTWNGDGGPPGNRYFLSIYPAILFLLPASTRRLSATVATVGGLALTGQMTASPFISAKNTWLAVERAPLNWFPVELTIMNALPVRLLDGTKARINWHTATYAQLYYLDENSYGVDRSGDAEGLWLRGAARAEIVIKTDRPLTRIEFEATTPIENVFRVSMGREQWAGSVGPGRAAQFTFTPPPGVWSKGAWVYQLTVETEKGFYPRDLEPGSTDARYLGVFLKPRMVDATVR